MINWLVAGSLALVMVTSACAESAKGRAARVVRLKGSARYSTGNNVWQQVKTGTLLKAGFLIQTAADSYVDLMLGESAMTTPGATVGAGTGAGSGVGIGYQPKAEQDMIRVHADTVLAIEKLSVMDTGADEITETELDLRSGKIFGTVKKMSPNSHYEIKLPNGVAGIRGTIYTVSANGVVQVLSGSLVVSWTAADGTVMTQPVNAGNQFDTHSGLLTPISDFDQKELIRQAKAARIGPHAPPISFGQDLTLYYVSPTQGHNGNAGATPPEGASQGSGFEISRQLAAEQVRNGVLPPLPATSIPPTP
jgi:hypothetical protein